MINKTQKTVHKVILFSTLLCIGILVLGCDKKMSNSRKVEFAYELSDTAIIRSLNQLALIKNPTKLNKSQQAKYNLVKVKGELRTGKICMYDSLLKPAITHYKSVQDTALLYECLYFLAWGKNIIDKDYHTSLKVLDGIKKDHFPFKAKSHFLYSLDKMTQSNLIQLNQAQKAEKIAHITLQQHALKKGTRDEKIRALIMLATANSHNSRPAASEHNYLKALKLTESTEHYPYRKYILDQLTLLMEKSEQYDKALLYARQAERLRLSRNDIPETNLAKALLFYKKNELDSAHHYARIAANGTDLFISNIASSYISRWYANEGAYFEAFHKYQTAAWMTKNIESGINSQVRSEVFAKKELENENNLLKIEQQKKSIFFIVIISILLLGTGFSYLLFYRKQRTQHEMNLRTKSLQLEQDNLLLKQSKEISSLREKEALLRESLFRKIDLFKKIPSVTPKGKDEKSKTHKIALTESDWSELVRTIDEVHPAFTARLKQQYPSLSIEDLYFCCFLKINVNLQDLSDIYCVSKAAISKKKYRIKTDKLHIMDNLINLDSFLKTF